LKLIQVNPRAVGRRSRQFWNGPRLQSRYEPNRGYSFKPSDNLGNYQIPGQRLPRRRPDTIVRAIIVACTGIWGWLYYQKSEAQKGSKKARQALADFEKHGVLSLQNLRDGRLYTILTHTFVHYQPMHLLANMVTLWSFGPPIVMAFGVPTFVVLWVGAGVVGGAAQSYYWLTHRHHAEASAVGASGSVLGILGALTLAMPRWRILIFPIPIPIPLLTATAAEVAFSLAAIQNDWLPNIGHVDHLAGTAFGALLYLIALRRRF
jgi:membrane associated rhomboid family serine protease